MFRNILTGVAVIALVAGAGAQQKAQMTVKKAATPQFAGVYTPSQGFVSSNPNSRSGPDVLHNNMTLSNYYSVPGAYQEWVDEFAMADRGVNDTEQLNGFDFIYCSSEVDSATGNTGTCTLNFYDENIYCGGPVNWPTADCSYAIAGIPMTDANGNFACWIVGVDLQGGAECNLTTEGAAMKLGGWGAVWDHGNTGPWLASGGYGNGDAFTWFDTLTGTLTGCYWFGGVPFAGFGIQMYGTVDDTQAYYSSAPDVNDTLTYSCPTAVVGGSTATFEVADPASGADYRMIAAPNSLEMGFNDGTLLVDYFNRFNGSPFLMPGGSLTVNVPSLSGSVYTQAAETMGSATNVTAFSNGLVHHF